MNLRTFLRQSLLGLSAVVLPGVTFAITYPLPKDGSNIVGEVQTAVVEQGDNLSDIARQYNIGYYELLEANPNLNPQALTPGMELVIPTQFILPDAPRHGIVINLAELRLYYYPEGRNEVLTEPVGIGRQGWETPEGTATITDHRENPTWTAPLSVREDMAKRGVYIPAKMPPGPDNPLGNHAMRISMPGYVIHGTNRPDGVGRRVSAGCIRMYPEGVKRLFDEVDVGTEITIVNDVFKAGWDGDTLYLEAHRPLKEQREELKKTRQKLIEWAKAPLTNAVGEQAVALQWPAVQQVANQQLGIPQPVGLKQNSSLMAATEPAEENAHSS